MRKKTRVNLVSAVNAKNVSKADGKYLVRDVVACIDDLVMNSRLYPAQELATAAKGLEGKPAPAGHPKDSKGRHISATNGEALSSAWIGAWCTNARHEGGRTTVDVVINEAQARAVPDGVALADRLDAVINGDSKEPVHVSTGLFLREVVANGESRGKKYRAIATDLQYDHLAILLNEKGAGTPEEGVGMFINADGEEEPVEVVNIDDAPADLRDRDSGALAWVRRLLGLNRDEMSFDEIQSAVRKALPKDAWPVEIYSRSVIWVDAANTLWQQDYAISSDGEVSLNGSPVQVERKVEYKPVGNTHQEVDAVKEQIIAALNAAGINAEGMTDAQALSAYNALVSKPHVEALTAANSKIAGFEAEAVAAQNAERDSLATELATNSTLTADDFKAMPLARLKELKAKAAPVVVGNTGTGGDEFATYSLNSHFEEQK